MKIETPIIRNRIPTQKSPQLAVMHSVPLPLSATHLSHPALTIWVCRSLQHIAATTQRLWFLSRARARRLSYVKDLAAIVPDRVAVW